MTYGLCALCGERIAKSQATRHVRKCAALHPPPYPLAGEAVFVLVEGRYQPDYWLHLLVPETVNLGVLDGFLRTIWLECCDHLSAFRGKDVTYSSEVVDYFEPDPESMRQMAAEVGWPEGQLEKLFAFRHRERGMYHPVAEAMSSGKLDYTYDFGTSTDLRLTLKGRAELPLSRYGLITLLARNEAPEYTCCECGKPATEICTECRWDGEAGLCESCAEKHECGEETLLPLVNSPRVGDCGYDGPAEAPKFLDESAVAPELLPAFHEALDHIAAHLLGVSRRHAELSSALALRSYANAPVLVAQRPPLEVAGACAYGYVQVYRKGDPEWPAKLTPAAAAQLFGVPKDTAASLGKRLVKAARW